MKPNPKNSPEEPKEDWLKNNDSTQLSFTEKLFLVSDEEA